jgi:hypothetical protein
MYKMKVGRGSKIYETARIIQAREVVCVTRRNLHITIGDFAVVGALGYIDKDVPLYPVIYPQRKHFTKRRIFK